jgi:hypothetical protein
MRLAKHVIKKPMWHDIRGIYQLCREKYSDELGQVKTPEQAKLYEFELTAGFKAVFSHTCRVWLCHSKLPLILKPEKSK